MARVFITGSSTGFGLMAGQLLVEQGHAASCMRATGPSRGRPPGAAAGRGHRARRSLDHRGRAQRRRSVNRSAGSTRSSTTSASAIARRRRPRPRAAFRTLRRQCPRALFLTALIERPDRLVYLSSGMHRGAPRGLDDLPGAARRNAPRPIPRASGATFCSPSPWRVAGRACCRTPSIPAGSRPAWAVRGARRSRPRPRTQVWLAVSHDPQARVTGKYFHHLRAGARPADGFARFAGRLIAECGRLSGVALPD